METVLAVLGLVVCVLLAVRLLLGDERQQRINEGLRTVGRTVKAWGWQIRHGRAVRKEASRMAEEVIRRARVRDEGEWEGNVFHPDSFKLPREKPHKPH